MHGSRAAPLFAWTVKDRARADPGAREELLRHNKYNRRLFRYLYERAMRGEGLHISMTNCYRETDYGSRWSA